MLKYKIQNFLFCDFHAFLGKDILISTPIFRAKGKIDIVDNHNKQLRVNGILDGISFTGTIYHMKKSCFCMHLKEMCENYKMENIQIIIS